MQGVRRAWNLRARSSAPSVQGVWWVTNLRARSSALYVQGLRWGRNLRARSSALYVQGVRWVCINLRARGDRARLGGDARGDERGALAGLNLGGLGSAPGRAGAQDF